MLALAPGLTLIMLLAACGAPASDAAAVKRACSQVGAVLADGPDPDADPAGYAEAQILPLRPGQGPRPGLPGGLSRLDAAYRQLFASDGPERRGHLGRGDGQQEDQRDLPRGGVMRPSAGMRATRWLGAGGGRAGGLRRAGRLRQQLTPAARPR